MRTVPDLQLYIDLADIAAMELKTLALEYQRDSRSLLRVYAVFAACWIAVCIFSLVKLMNNHEVNHRLGFIWAAAGIGAPVLGYLFFFLIVPGIIRSFKIGTQVQMR
jgi:hypothetical protein